LNRVFCLRAMAPTHKISYRSTRGGDTGLSFEEAVFSGLASDGGLLVPSEVPDVSPTQLKEWSTLNFGDLAYEIASLFCPQDEVPAADLKRLMTSSYSTFAHKDVVPLVPIGDFHMMELFHGPTFAFKDVALQALGNLYEYFLQRKARRLTVVGATSGDTGGAAIYGMRGKENVECFILFPKGKISKIQQQQMTSVLDANVHCVAMEGTFDDCQDVVKGLFADLDFKKQYGLGAVNSINWARIMFQITYYFYTYFKLFPKCDGKVSFSVPTGNFGDILAGYYAKRMGLPVKHMIVATNSNDILHRFFTNGEYDKLPVNATCSPSMDIGVSSNFERYLFYLFGSDAKTLAGTMETFKTTGKLHVKGEQLAEAQAVFLSGRADEAQIAATIKNYQEKYDYLLCPHSACGVAAIDHLRKTTSWEKEEKHEMVVLATAHPGKFNDAMEKITGSWPVLPPALAAVQNAEVRCMDILEKGHLPNSMKAVRETIERVVAAREKESKSPRGVKRVAGS